LRTGGYNVAKERRGVEEEESTSTGESKSILELTSNFPQSLAA
jgi:hypothetical protein